MCACREVVRNHLLALRWMNPGAVVVLRETKGFGDSNIKYKLCKGATRHRPSCLLQLS